MPCEIEIQRTINDQYTLITLECYPAYWDREILDFDIVQAWGVDLDREVGVDHKSIQLTQSEQDTAWEKLSD